MVQTLKEGGRELQIRVLEALKKSVALYGDESEITHPEWDGETFDVLTAELTRFGERRDTCMGEYFFRTVAGDPEGSQYFISLITLRNDIPAERVPELAFALSMTNFYIETGCFAISKPADLLVFRNTRSFPGDTPEEVLIKECRLQTEEAYEIASKYCTPILAVAEHSMELKDYLDLLQTGM